MLICSLLKRRRHGIETNRRKANVMKSCSYCIRNLAFSPAFIPMVYEDDDSGYAGDVTCDCVFICMARCLIFENE